jgi:hypothetical protein
VHGYEQAGDLAELFARPLLRRKKLAAIRAARGAASGGVEPPSAGAGRGRPAPAAGAATSDGVIS